MVLVNYRSRTEAVEDETSWLVWVLDRFEGRAAALFLVLAGVGISLRSRRARVNPERYASFERTALLKRALVLLAAGLLNLHIWDWDILHFYGFFIALGALVITVPTWSLWLMAVAFIGGQMILHSGGIEYDVDNDIWSTQGAVADLFFNGLHPLFPWVAFLLVGMWLGRADLKNAALRIRVMLGAVAVAAIAEGIDSVAIRHPEWLGLDPVTAEWLYAWPRPPLPVYVVAAGATAVAVICACIAVTEPRPKRPWVVALTATGQLAFTLYIAHAIAIEIPIEHGYLEGGSLAMALAYAFAFYAFAIASSLWWRRRFPHGPLEGFIRQVTGRTTPAPWGGQLASASRRRSEPPAPPPASGRAPDRSRRAAE
jgi:uncharacterized membrane protein YeiB